MFPSCVRKACIYSTYIFHFVLRARLCVAPLDGVAHPIVGSIEGNVVERRSPLLTPRATQLLIPLFVGFCSPSTCNCVRVDSALMLIHDESTRRRRSRTVSLSLRTAHFGTSESRLRIGTVMMNSNYQIRVTLEKFCAHQFRLVIMKDVHEFYLDFHGNKSPVTDP